MSQSESATLVFPHHAAKRARQEAALETVMNRMFRRVDADAYAAGNLEIERDELDRRENQHGERWDGQS